MRDIPSIGASTREMVTAIRQLIAGRSNACGTVTLTANVTQTTVTGPNVNEDAHVFLSPRTANAAGAVATTHAVVQRISGVPTIVITHANAATTDRTFSYACLGG